MRISEQQVEAAEQRAVLAEGERDAAARELELSPYSDLAAAKHSEAARTAAQLRANARELRQAYEQQVAEEMRRASRPELEKAAAAAIGAARSEMAGLHEGFVEALAGAQEALVALVEAAGAYNAAIESHTDVLAAAGLDARGGETGGERNSLGGARLKVDGRVYEPVTEGGAPAWVLRRVVEGRVSKWHHLLGALAGAALDAEQKVPDVLAQAPELAPGRGGTRTLVGAFKSLRGSR
ncbi:hypothetical protein ABZ016_23930 [Streptomyces sp. NPDC006372]|uniref:hypothetical protein n=1 Tax=Streptomyces sp. NPDC006372 TaxID=3155599 RepID=UPI0033BE3802